MTTDSSLERPFYRKSLDRRPRSPNGGRHTGSGGRRQPRCEDGDNNNTFSIPGHEEGHEKRERVRLEIWAVDAAPGVDQ